MSEYCGHVQPGARSGFVLYACSPHVTWCRSGLMSEYGGHVQPGARSGYVRYACCAGSAFLSLQSLMVMTKTARNGRVDRWAMPGEDAVSAAVLPSTIA
ncbi:hypothetical protein TrRE_jg316 [Triparma retinervis]|uniref:Uncharacterized protein n=1 Tax=Triparma retinervis TaxID=2557542 RepID=A0A9W7FYN1_9STRA|nr:hypothetical protein TrRE_jg316 [Triparma retinervis]